QDTLLRMFGVMVRTNEAIADTRAYLLRTATRLWIDRVRREARLVPAVDAAGAETVAARDDSGGDPAAIESMFRTLHPQERAAVVMREAPDMPLAEIASALGTSVGAVKSALHRARSRLDDRKPPAGLPTPPRDVVELFASALARRDVNAIRLLCAEN